MTSNLNSDNQGNNYNDNYKLKESNYKKFDVIKMITLTL